MFSEQVEVEQMEIPGRVDDVILFVLLRVKQHDDTTATQTVRFIQSEITAVSLYDKHLSSPALKENQDEL